MDDRENSSADEPDAGGVTRNERSFLMHQPPAQMDDGSKGEKGEPAKAEEQAPKPSQAEGEDPDAEPQGTAAPQEGHPSQAEGEPGQASNHP